MSDAKIVSYNTKQAVINLRNAGLSFNKIADRLRITRQAANYHWHNRHKKPLPKFVRNDSSIPDELFDELSIKGKLKANVDFPS